MREKSYHVPVLVQEVLTYMSPRPGGIYVDATFGGGGHTRALLEHQPQCTVIGLDWDLKALELNAPPLEAEFKERFKRLWGNFAQLQFLLKRERIGKIDGILADFGTSQYQIKQQAGFSFAHDTPLDMRMSPAHQKDTAYDIVNKATEKELVHIFQEYGEEWHARSIVRALVEARGIARIKTTGQLAKIILEVVHPKPPYRIHPATKVFQALRIAVNQELNNIRSLLAQSLELLVPCGRLVCISFHSLEDRMVKQFLRAHKEQFHSLTHKVVKAGAAEVSINPSSRSACLRAAELKTAGAN